MCRSLIAVGLTFAVFLVAVVPDCLGAVTAEKSQPGAPKLVSSGVPLSTDEAAAAGSAEQTTAADQKAGEGDLDEVVIMIIGGLIIVAVLVVAAAD